MTESTLSDGDKALIDDEVQMAARVARRLAKSVEPSEATKIDTADKRAAAEAELLALREQIGEARAEDVPALLAQMMRMAGVRAVEGPRATLTADPKSPYFGHLRLKEGTRTRDVLIGRRGMIDRQAGVVIVDWRDAPISRLYYRYDEGDEYEEELGEGTREGTMLVRRTVTFNDGELVRVKSSAGTFAARRSDQGRSWHKLDIRHVELRGGMGKAERAPQNQARRMGALGDVHLRADKHLPEIAALIDGRQFDAMTETQSGVVVLQGGAGSGKTTVALHRVAWLCFADPQRFRAQHVLVVVGQPQLARYVERMLPALDVAAVRVRAYDTFAKDSIKRLLFASSKMPEVLVDVPLDVARLKKHPGMLVAAASQVAETLARIDVAVAAATDGRDGASLLPARDATTGAPIPQLEAWQLALQASKAPKDTVERATRAVSAGIAQFKDIITAHAELITDGKRLSVCCDEARFAAFALEQQSLKEALAYTKAQIDDPHEDDDIDEDKKTPIDADHSREADPRGSLDVHDLPLLLCMWAARYGDLHPIAFDHVCVDEAQDLAAIELAPLIVAAGQHQSVTLAGDVVQKVVFDNGYEQWNELLQQLAPYLKKTVRNVEPFRLSYRSTAEVVAFGREILGHLAPKEPPQAVRSGAPVEVFAFTDTGEELAFLAEELRSLMAREPMANVAVLCRYPERARFIAKILGDAEVPRLRLVLGASEHDGVRAEGDDFTFQPGVDVTTIVRTKGLEYDYVVLAEVTSSMFPDNEPSRHLLHIGATRAAHQLWITTSRETPSPLLPPDMRGDVN